MYELLAERRAARAARPAEPAPKRVSKLDAISNLPAYLQAQGLGPEEVSVALRTAVATLMAEGGEVKMPIELRQQLMELEISERMKAAEDRISQESQNARAQEQASRFQYDVALASRQAAADGPYRHSVAFFGPGDGYGQAIIKKAMDTAQQAHAEGRVADLSIAAIQAALEEDLAERSQRLAALYAPQPTPQGATHRGAGQLTVSSTAGLSGAKTTGNAYLDAWAADNAAWKAANTK